MMIPRKAVSRAPRSLEPLGLRGRMRLHGGLRLGGLSFFSKYDMVALKEVTPIFSMCDRWIFAEGAGELFLGMRGLADAQDCVRLLWEVLRVAGQAFQYLDHWMVFFGMLPTGHRQGVDRLV